MYAFGIASGAPDAVVMAAGIPSDVTLTAEIPADVVMATGKPASGTPAPVGFFCCYWGCCWMTCYCCN